MPAKTTTPSKSELAATQEVKSLAQMISDDKIGYDSTRTTRDRVCDMQIPSPDIAEDHGISATQEPVGGGGPIAQVAPPPAPSTGPVLSPVNPYDSDLSKVLEKHHFHEYSLARSLPSRGLLSISVPDPVDPKAKFHYNYFTPNERAFIESDVDNLIYDSSSFNPEDIQYYSQTQKLPRFVKLKFNPPKLDPVYMENKKTGTIIQQETEDIEEYVMGSFKDIGVNLSLEDIVSAITVEGASSNFNFTGVEIVDTFADKKIYSMLSSSITFQNTDSPLDSPRERAQAFRDKISENGTRTPNPTGTDKSSLIDVLSNLQAAGISLAPNDVDESTAQLATDPITKQSFAVKFNNMFFRDIIDHSTMNANTVFEDEIRALKPFAEDISKTTTDLIDPTMSYEHDHGITIKPISMQALSFSQEDINNVVTSLNSVQNVLRNVPGIDAIGSPENPYSQLVYGILSGMTNPVDFLLARHKIPQVKIVGYMIQKSEVLTNGTTKEFPNIFIDNPRTFSEFVDPDVRYGAVYNYKMRSVALAKSCIKVINKGTGTKEYAIASYLLVSEGKNIGVECVENIPPPPPVRISCYIDYEYRVPVITWELPLNKQRDIKRYQIFKRQDKIDANQNLIKAIDQPFTLVAEYDFDNSIYKASVNEVAQRENLFELLHSVKRYRDKDFNLDHDEAVYAIASVDAHGLSSGYSSQIQIKYDKYTNKLIKNVISHRSAPKPYPNLYIGQDFFEDVIKTSGKKRCTVFFDPEYYKIVKKVNTDDSSSNSEQKTQDIDYIKTSDTEFNYTLQMINVDLQEEQKVKFRVSDKSGHEIGIPASKISPTNLSFEFGNK